MVTLDRLSGGRAVLGVGIGAMPFEWDYLGEEPDQAVRGRLDEYLDLLPRLWSGAPVDHLGEHYRVSGRPSPSWWIENVHPWRFGWSAGRPLPEAEIRARLRAGP